MRIIAVVHNPTAIAAAVEVADPASQLKLTLAIPRGPQPSVCEAPPETHRCRSMNPRFKDIAASTALQP
ncbi:MAG: hypothetical protein ACI9MR_002403 [Myxococcota bacterium]|jgi:hypothetical protein